MLVNMGWTGEEQEMDLSAGAKDLSLLRSIQTGSGTLPQSSTCRKCGQEDRPSHLTLRQCQIWLGTEQTSWHLQVRAHRHGKVKIELST
jgi:hypothetical protein